MFNNQYLLIILNSPNMTMVKEYLIKTKHKRSNQTETNLELLGVFLVFLKRFLKLSPQFFQVLLILVNTAYFQAALCGVFRKNLSTSNPVSRLISSRVPDLLANQSLLTACGVTSSHALIQYPPPGRNYRVCV